MPKKIMVVDDDPVIVEYLVSIFQERGYETCSAEGGENALAIMERERPDLLTLDLEMPQEWGSRFYRKLAKDENLKKIPVIVISGLAGQHAVKDAVAFVRKPFDPDELLGIMKKTIG